MDLELVGYVMQPEEIGCRTDSPKNGKNGCTNYTKGEALEPPTLMIGCHKTRYYARRY